MFNLYNQTILLPLQRKANGFHPPILQTVINYIIIDIPTLFYPLLSSSFLYFHLLSSTFALFLYDLGSFLASPSVRIQFATKKTFDKHWNLLKSINISNNVKKEDGNSIKNHYTLTDTVLGR